MSIPKLPRVLNPQAYILQERSDTNWPHCHVIFRRDNAMRSGPWDPIKWPMAPGQGKFATCSCRWMHGPGLAPLQESRQPSLTKRCSNSPGLLHSPP